MIPSLTAYFLGVCLFATACPALARADTPASPLLAEQPATPPAAPASEIPVAEISASALPAEQQEAHELWSGSLYTSTYKAGVCIAPVGSVRGVLLLRTMGGKTDVYHFNGNLENGIVNATHSSGHRFEGTFPSADEVQGTITLKSGRSVSLSGKREHNVPLTESCRPLPQ